MSRSFFVRTARSFYLLNDSRATEFNQLNGLPLNRQTDAIAANRLRKHVTLRFLKRIN
jgi:hypothetical protein